MFREKRRSVKRQLKVECTHVVALIMFWETPERQQGFSELPNQWAGKTNPLGLKSEVVLPVEAIGLAVEHVSGAVFICTWFWPVSYLSSKGESRSSGHLPGTVGCHYRSVLGPAHTSSRPQLHW